MPPLVTVIVPAYRQPAFLAQALESLANQTHQAIEIIVIDDASGPEVVAQYRLPGNARLIVHETNKATAAISRNEALAIARGEFVTFLDQDDLFAPDKIARQVAVIEADPAALLTFCHYQLVDESLRALADQPPPRAVEPDAVAQLLKRNIVHCPAQVMMRRSAFGATGLFDETIRGAADYDMWLRAAMAGRIVGDTSSMVRYRCHGGQWSKQGVMVCRGSVRVLEKAVEWTCANRPDLAGLARRRLARWMRELAKAQLRSDNERHLALGPLVCSLRLRPWDPQTYRCLWRAWRAKRAGPGN